MNMEHGRPDRSSPGLNPVARRIPFVFCLSRESFMANHKKGCFNRNFKKNREIFNFFARVLDKLFFTRYIHYTVRWGFVSMRQGLALRPVVFFVSQQSKDRFSSLDIKSSGYSSVWCRHLPASVSETVECDLPAGESGPVEYIPPRAGE
ncbi:MAG: hypothetical protein LBN92_00800, partial [Treponema sp.]|nr:hypothetical protein [Treponema sp.]